MDANERDARPTRKRRSPERSVLHGVLRKHLLTFLARAGGSDHGDSGATRSLPAFVRRELYRYLECGLLAHGFARVHCASCGRDDLVAFACKGRGFCPSCCGRRIFVRTVLAWYRERTGSTGALEPLASDAGSASAASSATPNGDTRAEVFAQQSDRLDAGSFAPHGDSPGAGELAQPSNADALVSTQRRGSSGAVVFAQRFGSALNLNLHFHALVIDGVYASERPFAPPSFHAAPPLTDQDVVAITTVLRRRILRFLQRRGRLPRAEQREHPDLPESEPEPDGSGPTLVASGKDVIRLTVLGPAPYVQYWADGALGSWLGTYMEKFPMRNARVSGLVSALGIAIAHVGIASHGLGAPQVYDKVPSLAPPPPQAVSGAGAAPIVYSALPANSASGSSASHQPYIQPIPGPPGPAFSAPGSSQPKWTRTLTLGFFERRALRNENRRLAAIDRRVATLQSQNTALQNKMAAIAKEVNTRAGKTVGPVTGEARKANLQKIAELKRDNLRRDARSNPILPASLDRKLAAVDRKLTAGLKAVDVAAQKDTKRNDKLIARAAKYAKSVVKNNATIQQVKKKR